LQNPFFVVRLFVSSLRIGLLRSLPIPMFVLLWQKILRIETKGFDFSR